MPSNSRTWIWIVSAVVVVVIIIALVFWFVEKRSPYAPAVSGPKPAYAPAGQLVAGFPVGLLIDSGATITKSYSLAYSSTTDQYSVEWDSSSSPQSLAVGYTLYFQGDGWRIASETTTSSALRSIYAAGELGIVNFTAVAEGTGSAAVLSYVPAPQATALSAPALPADFPALLNPDASATVIAVDDSGSSTAAILMSKQNLTALVANFVAALTGAQWQIMQKQIASGSAFIAASSGSGQVSVVLQTAPLAETQIQIHYAK